jgi:hypothetical protein
MNEPSFSGQGEYEIKVKGHLDERWSLWFEGMSIDTGFNQDGKPVTTFTGPMVDQAALHGVLARIRDINMPLISVNQVEADLKDESQADLIDE